MSIGTKFFSSTTLILAIIAVFVFFYYPKQYKEIVLNTLELQVQSIAESVALGVAIGRESNNFKKIKEALTWVQQDPNVAFIVVYDHSGDPYASYNPSNYSIAGAKLNTKKRVSQTNELLSVVVPVSINNHDYGDLMVGYSLISLNNIISKNRLVTLFVCLGILVLGMGLSLVISKKITRPLLRLTKTAHEISEGHMYVRTDIDSNDEIGDLAKAMQVMLEKNEKAMHEIQGINIQLERAHNKALKSSQAKSEFLSRMSHELRTPMNAVLGFAQLLQVDSEGSKSIQDTRVRMILKAGNHLLDLIKDILDLAQIESGKTSLTMESVDLHSIFSEVMVLVSPLAEKRNITIDFGFYLNSRLAVFADRIRLKQVLFNLLSNAIKFNKDKGACEISATKIEAKNSQPARVLIRVKDTGIGIPKGKMKLLYLPFERLHTDNNEVEGTGIGLSITKKFVEIMGGTISMESVVGQGTCFTIGFLEGVPKEPEEEISVQQLRLITEGKLHSKEFKLLHIDDNPDNLELVDQILSTVPNIEVISAPRAERGIELARDHKPDLILMDINLPGMDGITAMKYLKKTEDTKDIPIFAISAFAMESDIDKAMEAGFDSYITKPIQVIPFLKKIMEFLGLEDNSTEMIRRSVEGG